MFRCWYQGLVDPLLCWWLSPPTLVLPFPMLALSNQQEGFTQLWSCIAIHNCGVVPWREAVYSCPGSKGGQGLLTLDSSRSTIHLCWLKSPGNRISVERKTRGFGLEVVLEYSHNINQFTALCLLGASATGVAFRGTRQGFV